MQNYDMNTNKKDKTIFVSHRSIDKDIADKLIDYLAILGIPQNCFFCSSLPGNDVIAKISDEVKQGLTDSLINIVILSKDYYESAYCLNEAGIIWYQNKTTIVVALPEINEKNMFGFLNSNFKLRRLSEKEDLVAIYDTIVNVLKLEKTNLQLLQRKTSTFASEFSKKIKEQPIITHIESENQISIDDLTDDEKLLLYYFARKNKKTLQIEDIKKEFDKNEIINIDINNGLVLLEESGFGTMNTYIFDIEIKHFRNLKQYLNSEPILSCLKSHILKRKDIFIKMYSSNKFNEADKLFIAYIFDTKSLTFGARWLEESEISSIKKWQDDNDLDSYLSDNYSECLQKFINNNLCYASDYTSYGNPKAFTLYNSLEQFINSLNTNILNEIKAIKEKHKNILPF